MFTKFLVSSLLLVSQMGLAEGLTTNMDLQRLPPYSTIQILSQFWVPAKATIVAINNIGGNGIPVPVVAP